MDVVMMILYTAVVLGVLVFVHEGGHYLAARAFGVRVTEFMLGLPGPSVGFTWKGTRFGVTAVPLGGYARICGMGSGEQSPYLKQVIKLVFERGTVTMEEVARALEISDDDAYNALEELAEWGTIAGPSRKDKINIYRTLEVKGVHELGTPQEIDDLDAFYEAEYAQQYRAIPFWKRSIILLAGVAVNLLFAILLFILIYSVIGFDATHPQTGELVHVTVDPLRAIGAGFNSIGMVITAVIGLFNPATAAQTISDSASIVGIAAMSKDAADAGFVNFLFFVAMISVSLGIMNLLPVPPLDGGRFVVEVFQKITRKPVTQRIMNALSVIGFLLIMALFVVMVGQDIQRFVFGNW